MSGVGDELVIRPDYRTGVLVLVILAVVAVGVIGAILVGDGAFPLKCGHLESWIMGPGEGCP